MKIFIYDESRALIRTVGTPDVMQGENNATLIFMSVAGIDQSNFQNYLAQFAATIGTSHPADVITDFGPYVLDGVTYYGWKYFVSSKFTQVAGVLNANLVLSSGGSTLISQTVSLNVNPSASGVTWFKNITQAQWEQLLAYCIGLRNPNLGVLSDEDGLDSYCNMGQAGAYLYVDEGGLSHLLFIGYDESQDRVYQTDYYNNNGALLCRQRWTTESVEDEWTNWVINSQASAISFNVSGLPQLTGANTVQKAIAALAHAVYPIAFVTSLAPAPFTSVDVPNSKDKIIKDDLGQDLNAGGVLDYAFAIFGRYVTHAFDFDNTLIMTSDGAIYRMKYENGSMVAHWFNGSPAQAKAEQALINQTLSNGIATNNSLIKNNVVGNCAITMDEDTYVITVTNTNLNGEVMSTYTIDIPAEMAFVSGRYDAEDRDLIFTLQNGNEVAVPVDDIFVGLATQDWVNTAIANALLPYATASWVDSNYMSLTKGGMVNLAEDPASANTNYFGAHHGTKSSVALSDNRFTYKVSDDSTAIVHDANRSAGGLVMWSVIDATTSPSTLKQTKLPFRAGSHFLAFQEDLDAANAKIAKQESDIQYLYRQVIGGGDLVTETDSGVSLTSQPFPLTVSPKALLDYVGGMCQKVNQHRRVTYGSVDDNAVQYELYKTESAIGLVYGHKYFVSFNAVIESDNTASLRFKLGSSGYNQFTMTANAGLNQQIGELTTATGPTEDSSYFMTFSAGYVHFSYSNLRIVDLTTIYGAGNEPTSTSDPRIQWLMSYLSSHPEYDAGSILTAPVTKVVSKDANDNVVKEYPVPAEVRALEGYGLGIDGTLYNYIDLEGKKFVKKVARVNLSTLNFAYNSVYGVYSSSGLSALIKVPASQNTVSEAKAEKYGMTYQNNITNAEIGTMCIVANGNIFIRANEGDVISGYFYYPLKEPVETDISEYIDSDVIEVTAGGHLEFENEDGLGVPYSVTYQCEPETQGGE